MTAKHIWAISPSVGAEVHAAQPASSGLPHVWQTLNALTDSNLIRKSDNVRIVTTDVNDYGCELRDHLGKNCSHHNPRASPTVSYDRADWRTDFQVADRVFDCSHAFSDATAGFAAGRIRPDGWNERSAEMSSRLNYRLKDPSSVQISGAVHVRELEQYFPSKVTVEAETPYMMDSAEASESQGSP